MEIVTLIPILAAGVMSVLIGYVWYHPRIFGTVWTRLINLSPQMVEEGQRHLHLRVVTGLVSSMLIAFIMTYVGAAWHVHDVGSALSFAVLLWGGFTAPVLLGSVLWEYRPLELYCINAGYWLVSFCAMAVVVLS